MIKNMHKTLFFLIMIMGTLITMSSNNWFSMWMGLEINLMAFIPLISKIKDKKSSQAMMTYFLTQSMGSILLMFSIMLNSIIILYPGLINEPIKILIMISVMIKVGAAPFHFWVPEMMSNLDWPKCLLLMTWQKIAPLIILNNTIPNNMFLYISVTLSTMVGSIGGLNQTSLRKLLAYSSINHLGWMMMFMSTNNSWYKYLMIYSLIMMMICSLLKDKNAYFMNQLMSYSPSMTEKLTYTTLMLSIGGLPPFLGFMPKWMVIQMMMDSKLYFMMVLMMMFSLLTLYYYMRMMISYIMMYSTMNKWNMYKSPNNYKMNTYMLLNMSLPIMTAMGMFS